MKSVALIPGLISFGYAGSAVSEVGIESLRNNRTIQELTLVTRPLPPNIAGVFQSMANLKSLTLFAYSVDESPNRNFSTTWLKGLIQLQQLNELKIGGGYVTDEDLAQLRTFLPNTAIEKLREEPF